MKATKTQVGGDHYKQYAIQPIDYIHANNIPFIEGCVIKYVTRWRSKGGVEDLRKARHMLDMLIELESPRPKKKLARDTRQLDIEEWLDAASDSSLPDRT